jgi:hypothetical protein
MNLLLFQKKRLSKGISLALDFMGGILDSRITFTRASSGTRVNSSGVIESIASNLPRFDYDTVTLAPKGLLIEEQRTNLLLQSAALATTPWSTSLGSVTANATTAPDGTLTASAITSTGGGVFQSISGTVAATVYTASIYVKYIGGGGQLTFGFNANPTSARANFNIQTGSLVSIDANATSATITSVGGGWYRCSVTATVTSTSTIIVDYSLTSGTSWYSWGAQLELGASPTSYIPTTSATVTRAADNASMVGTNFSSWYNQNEGTVVAEFDFDVYSPNRGIYSLNLANAPGNNRFDCRTSGFNNTANGVGLNSPSITFSSGVNKVASAYKVTDSAATKNGIIPTSYSLTTMPTVDRLLIGALDAQTNQLNGHLKSFKFFSKRFLNTYLRSLTQ